MGTITYKTVPNKVKIERIDFSKTGIVEYSEFLAVTCNHQELINETNLKECFKILAQDGDCITTETLEALFGQEGIEEHVWEIALLNDKTM
jgi:hypothetical protein